MLSRRRRPAPASLKERSVVCRRVWHEDLAEAVWHLAFFGDVHVLTKVVVVLHHVQLPDGRARARGWHPRSLPRRLLLHLALHDTHGRQIELTCEQFFKPERLHAVREDVVERGDFATNEGEIWDSRRDDASVEIQSILLHVQLILKKTVEDVIVL